MMSLSLPPGGPLDRPERVVTVLAVDVRDDDLRALRNIFCSSKWVLHEARSCREASDFLRSHQTGVVLCERDLPDGTWRYLLHLTAALPSPPPVVVTSSQADENLWAEVLNLGGYDVLAKPLERSEVVRILSLAWLYWKDLARSAAMPRGMAASASRSLASLG
jgi:DNA-binding NtrC family response regulator